ncbi:MAG: HlyD family efflux transporter periplasmic adaptor subunit [Acidobacteriota bacterium]
MNVRTSALFPDSSRLLRDNSSCFVVCLLGLVVLALWSLWFFLVPITRFEASTMARIEVDQAAHLIQAHVSGRVLRSHLVVGREVRLGEVLVEMEQEAQELRLSEERAKLAALVPQIAALQRELVTAEQAREQENQTWQLGVAQAHAQQKESDALASYAEQEAERAVRLHSEGLLSERDLVLGRTEASRRRAAAESLRLAAARLDQERSQRFKDRQAQLDRLRAEIIQLQEQIPIRTAVIDQLQFELGRRTIRAPVDGKLGEVATLRPGSFLQEGQGLGAVVPHGNLKIVAEFLPSAALGQIKTGQPAHLKLEGYPWAQYGMVHGVVTKVGSEVRDQTVRVESSADPLASSKIPMQHGLPGTIEIEVERITPAHLLLRLMGKALSENPANASVNNRM